jgi:hypothetical protein
MNNYKRAAEIIKESRFAEDIITVDEIALLIERYVDELIEEINNDPEYFFKENYRFWKQLNKVVIETERQSSFA